MAERDRFELDLATALRAFAENAPTEVHPSELARRFAVEYPHGRTAIPQAPGPGFPRRLAAAAGAPSGAGAGGDAGSRPESALPAVVSPASRHPRASPTANPDEALVATLTALMNDPYDAAKVAALFAPNAVIHETPANMTIDGSRADRDEDPRVQRRGVQDRRGLGPDPAGQLRRRLRQVRRRGDLARCPRGPRAGGRQGLEPLGVPGTVTRSRAGPNRSSVQEVASWRIKTSVRGSHLHRGWPGLGALFIAVALLGACGASATQSPASHRPQLRRPRPTPMRRSWPTCQP